MKVHYPKLYNMAHLLLSLNVFSASKGSNNYILFMCNMTSMSDTPVILSEVHVMLPVLIFLISDFDSEV